MEYTYGRFHCDCEIRRMNCGAWSAYYVLEIRTETRFVIMFFLSPKWRGSLVATSITILFHFFQIRNAKALDFCIEKYFNRVQVVQKLHEIAKYPILDLYSRDMIAKPRETLHKLCQYLTVTCYDEFINSTIKILYSKAAKTRYSVEWTNQQKQRVTYEISQYTFLKSQFTFDSD